MASGKPRPEADDLLHLEANKSPSVTDNTASAATKTSSSDHEDREEKIDELEEDSPSAAAAGGTGLGQGRHRRELSIKNKEVLNSSRTEANNSAGSPAPVVDSAPRSKKGQQKKRKTDEDTSSGSKTEEPALKMRIKRKKMATRQSTARRSIRSREDDDEEDEESNSPEEEQNSSPPLSESASPRRNSPAHETHPKHESIIMEERRGANKEKKRKLSSSSSTPGGKGLASASSSPKPTSFSCQQGAGKRCSTTLSSSSAPASPAAEAVVIRSRRSSPAIISTSSMTTTTVNANTVGRPLLGGQIDRSSSSPATFESDGCKTETEMNAAVDGDSDRKGKRESLDQPVAKKAKMNSNRKDDLVEKSQEKAIPSSISATVTTLVPVYDPSREKPEQHDAGTWVRTTGTSTEAECFGPCEPGTSVTLEGIVWNETKGGILVVNVTWRGKTYVGTLLDCTKYDWAPPQLCDSPSASENDSLSSSGPWSHLGNSNHRSKAGNANGNGRGRKGHGGNRAEAKRQQQAANANHSANGNGTSETNSEQDQNNETRVKKPAVVSGSALEADAPVLFQCPFGTCEKKFSAVIGLKYHQTSSHRNVICKMSDKHLNHYSAAFGSKSAQAKLKLESKAGLDEKPNLDELFKTAQGKPPGHVQDQQQTNSPVYSDISEDDAVAAPPLQPVLDETVPTALPQLTPTAATEKPMAIVEPQCASSASTSTRPAPAEQRSMPALCTTKPGQPSAKMGKDSDNGVGKCGSVCPPLLPTLEATNRHKKPIAIAKLEPTSPRPTSAVLEFAVPAPPASASGVGPSSSTLPVPIAQSSMGHPNRPGTASSQHQMNMINQLNHPAFMFNPFNPTSAAAMFPGGQMVPQSVFQSQGLGLDTSSAAAAAATLMAAGQQTAGMYGSSAALAAAAGFPMGLHSPPGSSPHGLFGGSPMVSMAPGFGPSNLNLSPSAASLASASRLQQAHKIHELAEHAKRVQSTAGDTSVIVEALRRSQVANMSPSPSVTAVQSQRPRQLTPVSALDQEPSQRPPSHLTPSKSGSVSSTTSSTSVPTSVIASPIAGNPGLGTTGDPPKPQQGSLTKVASAPSRSGMVSVSPPVQRHLHTHHHTHTTYPLLAPGLDPYSAAMVASQQAAAAAASVVGGYSPFGSSAKP